MKKTWLGILLGVGILGVLILKVGSGELKDALLQAQLAWLVLGMALKIPVMWLKSRRWAIAIQEATGRPVRAAFSASMIGFAGNLVLPARLGEWARVSVIDKHNHTGRTLALAALIATQVFDLSLLLGCFLVASAYVSGQFGGHHWEAAGFLLVLLFALVLLELLRRRPAGFFAWWNSVLKRMPESLSCLFTQKLQLCLQGLSCLSRGRAMTWILLLTLLAWGTETASVLAVLRSFHIDATAVMAITLVVFSNLAFLMPITPGNLGVVQVVSVFMLGTFGVPPAPALAYAVAHQGMFYVVIASVGLSCFYREGMSLNLFRARLREGALNKAARVIRP